MTRLLAIFAVAFGLWLLPYSGDAQDISIKTRVIDGMTLEVQGQRLCLFGIDAPDLKQSQKGPPGPLERRFRHALGIASKPMTRR